MSQAGAAWRWQDQDLILSILVQPGARRTEVVGLHGAAIKIRLQARPVEGAANEALICFLSEQFKVRQNRISLLQGAINRLKVLQLERPDPEQAVARLRAWGLI